MLARTLRLALAIELAIGLWLGWRVGRSFDAPMLGALLGPVVVIIGLQLAIAALSFVTALPYRHARDCGVRLGPARSARWIITESAALVFAYVVLQPFASWFVRGPARATAPTRLPPVVLVHGIYCNAAAWWFLRRRLVAAGVRSIHALDLEPPLASIDDFARQLAQCIDRVLGETGADRVVVVGHSMGGLVARATLMLPQMAHRFAKLITISTPHHGSRHARLGIGIDCRQLVPGNDWLEHLNANPASWAVPIVSIYSRHDNLVAPQDSAVLTGATMVALDGLGHVSALTSEEVAQIVIREIATLSEATVPSGS